MEKYLTASQIAVYPLGKKYKKNTYGGRKFFMKLALNSNANKQIVAEFYYRGNRWQLDRAERDRIYKLDVNKVALKIILTKINEKHTQKPVNLSITKEEYLSLYSSYADVDELGYYKNNSPEYVRVNDILSAIKEKSLVYDVGCNSGGIGSLLIKRKKCQVFGSEICPCLAKRAQEKGIEMFCGWAEKVPFNDNFFDFVVATFILEHVIDPREMMMETLRVLKKGGVIMGHVPTEFGDWGKKTIGSHPEHLRAYSAKELKFFLESFKLNSIIIKKEKLIGRRVADYYFFKAKK